VSQEEQLTPDILISLEKLKGLPKPHQVRATAKMVLYQLQACVKVLEDVLQVDDFRPEQPPAQPDN